MWKWSFAFLHVRHFWYICNKNNNNNNNNNTFSTSKLDLVTSKLVIALISVSYQIKYIFSWCQFSELSQQIRPGNLAKMIVCYCVISVVNKRQ